MHKGMLLLTVLLIGVMIAIPAILVRFDDEDPLTKNNASGQTALDSGPTIKVYLTEEKQVEKVPLERYIRGVVAAEMPADFHLEALKAQAMVARTYIVDRLAKGNFDDMQEMGGKAAEAHVTDSVNHQVYRNDEALKAEWGEKYDTYVKRINQAVAETKGQVILYEGEPIYAAFFSTSNGQTENSEDYFSSSYPYLRSVPSPWDQASPKFNDQKSYSVQEFVQHLTQSTGKEVAVSASVGNGWLKVIEQTEGGRIAKIQVGDQVFTGRQVREALDLSSSDFKWKVEGDTITLTTEGYGHGVGMSQWGANLMGKKGKRAEEIIHYYYQGVTIAGMEKTLAQIEDDN